MSSCMTIISQHSLPPIMNWRILLEHFYCPHALVTAASAFKLGRRHWSLVLPMSYSCRAINWNSFLLLVSVITLQKNHLISCTSVLTLLFGGFVRFPSPPVVIMIIWRIREKIIRTVLCCGRQLCTMIHTHTQSHTYEQFFKFSVGLGCFCVFV